MTNEQHRHDITDGAWAVIEPHTIGNKGSWGGNARDTRQFINAVFWILRTGAPWRELPPEYGDLEEYAQAILPMARQADLGENP